MKTRILTGGLLLAALVLLAWPPTEAAAPPDARLITVEVRKVAPPIVVSAEFTAEYAKENIPKMSWSLYVRGPENALIPVADARQKVDEAYCYEQKFGPAGSPNEQQFAAAKGLILGELARLPAGQGGIRRHAGRYCLTTHPPQPFGVTASDAAAGIRRGILET